MPDPVPLLQVRDLYVRFDGTGGSTRHQVLAGVNLTLARGELLGVIGGTASGKTTLGRAIVGMTRIQRGTITLDGQPISGLGHRAQAALRRSGRIGFIFQDPLRSLDPRMTLADSVAEGLAIRGRGRRDRMQAAATAMELVGLDPALALRRPGEISGGQRQRAAIARSLALESELLICDEPVSALDAANRGDILRLLTRIRDDLGVAMMVISHNLVSLAEVADSIAVLHDGRIIEHATAATVFSSPAHPYTERLIAASTALSHARQAGPGT